MTLGEVCEHGSLKRSCLVCELTAERDALKAELSKSAMGYRGASSDRDRWRTLAGKLAEALKRIARSAPCVKGHMSHNSPEQICDQRIAEEALILCAAMEKGETKTDAK